VALILHTSGTTSRPKIVPLLQSNVAASAKNIADLAGAHARRPLPERDAAVPHSRAAGGGVGLARRRRAVWCAPGFDALKFFGWLREARSDLVHRRADDASGDPVARGPQRRDHRERRCASCAPPRPRCPAR
jgi:hypothetical protein